ncbi:MULTISPECIES: glycosyltransferase family 4 protein [Haloferax]|uniref:Glycosyltransferase n=1 Tax=Haloferax marinum TaxID=2666143 RepID=A0A6A8G9M1_9EURY|nr:MULTISPECIES: glycosyltransferase family 4 protein [Haloferax]KAB1198211.1 glycosyltransferase family 4 protein [Haloferax sp. CBA1150]MRW97298.1 glycosyltransferase [Haloferax marinum]
MKVLNLVTTPRPFFDSQLQSLRDLGVEVDVLPVPGRDSQEESRSITDYFEYYPQVLSEQSNNYDIIHANYGNTAPFAVFQPTRPIVITYWGSDLMGPLSAFNSSFSHVFDEVILPSPVLSEYIPNEHHVIPFDVDTKLFRPISMSESRDVLGWKDGTNYVLFPYSKSRSEKNYPLAKKIVDDINRSVNLVTISDVEHEMMPLYMNASDAVLVTSKRESGPMVVKEAALCNVPVVSTDVGFASDVLSDVKNSYVCNSETEIVNRLQDILRSGQRSDGRKHAEKWGKEAMGKRLLKVYESALSK